MCMERRRFSQTMAFEWQTAFVVSHKMPCCALLTAVKNYNKSLEKLQDFFFKTKTKTKCPRPRPRVHEPRTRPRLSFLSSRCLKTKTLVSRTASLVWSVTRLCRLLVQGRTAFLSANQQCWSTYTHQQVSGTETIPCLLSSNSSFTSTSLRILANRVLASCLHRSTNLTYTGALAHQFISTTKCTSEFNVVGVCCMRCQQQQCSPSLTQTTRYCHGLDYYQLPSTVMSVYQTTLCLSLPSEWVSSFLTAHQHRKAI